MTWLERLGRGQPEDVKARAGVYARRWGGDQRARKRRIRHYANGYRDSFSHLTGLAELLERVELALRDCEGADDEYAREMAKAHARATLTALREWRDGKGETETLATAPASMSY